MIFTWPDGLDLGDDIPKERTSWKEKSFIAINTKMQAIKFQL